MGAGENSGGRRHSRVGAGVTLHRHALGYGRRGGGLCWRRRRRQLVRHRRPAAIEGPRAEAGTHRRRRAQRTRRHGWARAGQGRGQQVDRPAAGRSQTPRAKYAGHADEPAYGVHRPARRRQDAGGARSRRHLSLAARAAQRPPGRDRPCRSGRRLYRTDRHQDTGEMQASARRHPVHRRGLCARRQRRVDR